MYPTTNTPHNSCRYVNTVKKGRYGLIYTANEKAKLLADTFQLQFTNNKSPPLPEVTNSVPTHKRPGKDQITKCSSQKCTQYNNFILKRLPSPKLVSDSTEKSNNYHNSEAK